MTTTADNLDELWSIYAAVVNEGSWTSLVVYNRWMVLSIIDSTEDGDLFYTQTPTDDADQTAVGLVRPDEATGWPLVVVWPRPLAEAQS